MGRATIQTPAATTPPPLSTRVTHFTHPHELHPTTNYSPQTPCTGCKLPPSGTCMYTCKLPSCNNFTLHQSCAKLPRLITHSSHTGCTLSLLTATPYPGGVFSCDACGRNGDTWSYHCYKCEYDLHVTCASRPLNIRHWAHGTCELSLTFKNPYGNSTGFSCDVCRKIGSNQWLYRCNTCEFDLHLDCAAAAPPQPALQHQHSWPVGVPVHQNQPLMHSLSTGAVNHQNPALCQPVVGQVNANVSPAMQQPSTRINVVNPYGANQITPVGYAPPQPGQVVYNGQAGMMQGNQQRINQPTGLGTTLMTSAMQGLVEGAFQGIGQAVVQEVLCDDGGDGDGDISTY